MNPQTDKTALILTGGGARGAYQVGVLCALGEALGAKERPFDVITGVSVGAINAACLTAGADDIGTAIRKMGDLWAGLHTQNIYRADVATMARTILAYGGSALFGWAGIRPPKSILDNEPLGELLAREVDFTRLARMVEGPTLDALAITASSYEDGTSVSFYHGSTPARPWQRSRRVGITGKITAEHIMASAALPFVFPSVKIGGEYYGDGALRQIAPLSPAIHLGCNKLFLIGARDAEIGGEPENAPAYPSPGVIAGQLLDIVFNDNLEADVERLKRINSTLDSMMPERRALTDLRHVEVMMLQPSEDVRKIAARHVAELPWSVKALLRALGAWKAPWVLPSYLMFEPGYVCALMDLGRKDATARMDEIRDFLRC
ncbi:patatin-like phospholipase family protein [Aquisalinus flavus]|uniref:PNPLA domain-containing protein n=1 Tax=Aquisalinus flavus TaxID=1526572 RepID=A0A8J2Y5J1_9PROT|nr:patatin-like phospholipase family protein [Aquisalinus flavus]MBD0427124.1 patatin-like phospholipase family protein [Aquisalinus flavus]UNE46945.1 patatin-like phospholipase family protein [Aquisalinus flavus]GGC98567.1 hypothetical protein GCM10011342_04380 [Aquisalinus flavus]